MERSTLPSTTEEISVKRKISIDVPLNGKPEDETKAEETKAANGSLDKKIIKLSDLSKLDPLEYFARFLDISEMILKHLSGKEVLAASEVNPSWYNFIASSKVLMEKLKVVFDCDFDFNGEELVRTPGGNPSWYSFIASSTDLMEIKINFHDKCATHSEDCNLLKDSSRLYQNIEVRRKMVIINNKNGNQREVGDYVTNSELDFFQSKAHEWKNVSFQHVYFRKMLDMWKLLSSIELSIESIFLEEYGDLSLEDPSSEIDSFEALKFPKLKKFSVRLYENSSMGDTLARFLLNSVAIEELDLMDCHGRVGKDIITKMLTNFDNLKRLNISSKVINQIFEDESWKNFQFKLKSLAIASIPLSLPVIGINFPNFLKSQSDYLEEVSISFHLEEKETLNMIMKMPKLKSLTLQYFYEAFSENEVPIKISTSITELCLNLCHHANAVSLKFLLDAMPKVTNLRLLKINEEIFKILKSTKRKFEKLKVEKLKGVDRKQLEEIMTENYTSLEVSPSALDGSEIMFSI